MEIGTKSRERLNRSNDDVKKNQKSGNYQTAVIECRISS
jgi:hypothetical protein